MPIPNLTEEKKKAIMGDIINNLENARDGAIQIADENLADGFDCIINDLRKDLK